MQQMHPSKLSIGPSSGLPLVGPMQSWWSHMVRLTPGLSQAAFL